MLETFLMPTFIMSSYHQYFIGYPKVPNLGTEKHSSKNADYIEMFSMSTILYPLSQAIKNCF